MQIRNKNKNKLTIRIINRKDQTTGKETGFQQGKITDYHLKATGHTLNSTGRPIFRIRIFLFITFAL